MFVMADGCCFPAEIALARKCDLLVDGGSEVFSEKTQTINLRIEVTGSFAILSSSLIEIPSLQWPGYEGWGGQANITLPMTRLTLTIS